MWEDLIETYPTMKIKRILIPHLNSIGAGGLVPNHRLVSNVLEAVRHELLGYALI